jgi:hypothetical protein
MKTQLIVLPEYNVIISDEKIKKGDWYYTEPFCNLSIRKCEDDRYDFTHCKKIISGTPELSSINYSALSEDDCKKIGYVDIYKIAEEKLKSHPDFKTEGFSDYQNGRLNGIVEGFELFQSLNDKKFSLEDIEKVWNMFVKEEPPINNGASSDFLVYLKQSLQQPKTFDIEVELEYKDGFGNWYEYTKLISESFKTVGLPFGLRPKITNDSIKITKVL